LRQRIARAKELLAETTEAVAGVARSSGFNNANRFYVTFRNQVGMSPRKYRSLFAP
jgi:transcriptional regulator GlxA family with amidase domain